MNDDLKFLKVCLKEAQKAYDLDEVPVGCCIVKNGKIIARSHNLRETKKSATAHAEILCIDKACKKLNEKFLDGCTIYITLEPCLMCLGAILQARIKEIVYSVSEPKFGAIESVGHVLDDYKFNVSCNYRSGILKDEVSQMMKSFFKTLRDKK